MKMLPPWPPSSSINAPYAGYVEFGTGVYAVHPSAPKAEIVPRSRKAMKFRVLRYPRPGKRVKETVFATKVRGERPQPFMRPAMDAAQGELAGIVERVRNRFGL